MSYKIVNLCPHDITLFLGKNDKTKVVFPRSKTVARLKDNVEDSNLFLFEHNSNGTEKTILIPTIKKRYGKIVNLPRRKKDTKFLVSLHVALAAWNEGRDDVITMGNIIRDEKKRILGCRSFSVMP